MPSPERAPLGRHRERHREHRHEQHHRHLDHAEVEIGARRVAPRLRARARRRRSGPARGWSAPWCRRRARGRPRSSAGRSADRAGRSSARAACGSSGALWTSRPFDRRNRIVSGSSVARKVPRSAVDGEAAPVARWSSADEDAVQIGAAILAALDPQGHPPPEIGELADLDRGAERARAQLEAQALIFILGLRLDEADDEKLSAEQDERVEIGHAQQPPVARARPRAAYRARRRARACGRRAARRASARPEWRGRDIRGSDWPASARRSLTGPPSRPTKSNRRSMRSSSSSIAARQSVPSSGTKISFAR